MLHVTQTKIVFYFNELIDITGVPAMRDRNKRIKELNYFIEGYELQRFQVRQTMQYATKIIARIHKLPANRQKAYLRMLQEVFTLWIETLDQETHVEIKKENLDLLNRLFTYQEYEFHHVNQQLKNMTSYIRNILH